MTTAVPPLVVSANCALLFVPPSSAICFAQPLNALFMVNRYLIERTGGILRTPSVALSLLNPLSMEDPSGKRGNITVHCRIPRAVPFGSATRRLMDLHLARVEHHRAHFAGEQDVLCADDGFLC